MVKVTYSKEEREDIQEAYSSVHHLFTDDRPEESSKYTEDLRVLQKAIETYLNKPNKVEFITKMLNRTDALYNEFTIVFPDLAKKDETFANIIKIAQEKEQYSATIQRIKDGLQPEFLTTLEEKISPHDQPAPKNELSEKEIKDLDEQYKKLTSNEERRKFVVEALNNDTLAGKAKDFFIEQFNKGEIFAGKLDEKTALKIAGLLKIGEIQDKDEAINVNGWRKYWLKKEIDANKERLAKDQIKKQREISLLKARTSGSTDKSVEELWTEYDNSKDKSERKYLKSMLKIVDINYSHNKKVKNKNPKDSRNYDYTGDSLKTVAKAKAKIDEYMEWQNTVAGSSFFSKPFRKQLNARFNLLLHRNPEKKVQKLLSTMNTRQVMAIKAEWDKNLAANKKNLQDTAVTRDKIKFDAQVKLFDSYIKLADKAYENKNAEFEKAKTAIENRPTKFKLSQKERISKYAAKLEANRLKKLENNPQIMAYNKLLEMAAGNDDLRKKIESSANARQDKQITADRVFEAVMKQNGFSDEEIAIFKQEYVPDINKPVDAKPDKDKETPLEDNTKEEEAKETKEAEGTKEQEAEENTEANEAEGEKPEGNAPEGNEEQTTEKANENETNEQEGPKGAKTPILNDGPAPENAEHGRSAEDIETFFADPGYDKVDTVAETSATSKTFKNKENGRMVTVEKTDDGNYYVTAKTQDGKDDKAQVDELVAVIKDMTKDGSKTIELGEVKSAEFLVRAELAAEKAGITISNLEEKKKELVSRDADNENKLNNELERAVAQDVAKELNIDINSQEGQTKAALKLIDLATVQTMSEKDYAEFKTWDMYKNMPDAEKKIFDNVHKLTTDEEFKKAPESVRYRALSKLIGKYQEANNKYSQEDKKKKVKRNVIQRGEEIVKKAVKGAEKGLDR